EATVQRLAEAQEALKAAGAIVRWVSPGNMHLTVKFLGPVEDQQLPDVCRAAEEIAGKVAPFEFAATALTSVPPAGQMRMVWCGIDEPTGRLAEMAELAELAYAEIGFKPEIRQFQPHLTLGRVKSGRNVPQLRQAVAAFADSGFGAQRAEEFIVFGSELGRGGPTYTPLATAALKGQDFLE
ncbi:hypothetical protein LCGC14_2475310, partial [marine sediment metagenome]